MMVRWSLVRWGSGECQSNVRLTSNLNLSLTLVDVKLIMILSTFIHWFYSFVKYVSPIFDDTFYVQNYKHFVDRTKWEKIQRFNFVWDHHFVNLKVKWINQFLEALGKQTFFHANSSEFSPSLFLYHWMKPKK